MSIAAQLKGMVRSKLWNLSRCEDEKVERPDKLHELAKSREDGPTQVDHQDEFERAIALLAVHPKVKGNAELELVVEAYYCGVEDVESISKETGLPPQRIYQLTRELRAIYPSIARQLRDGGRAS